MYSNQINFFKNLPITIGICYKLIFLKAYITISQREKTSFTIMAEKSPTGGHRCTVCNEHESAHGFHKCTKCIVQLQMSTEDTNQDRLRYVMEKAKQRKEEEEIMKRKREEEKKKEAEEYRRNNPYYHEFEEMIVTSRKTERNKGSKPANNTSKTGPPLYYLVTFCRSTGVHTRGDEPGSNDSLITSCSNTATQLMALWPAEIIHEWEAMVALYKASNTSPTPETRPPLTTPETRQPLATPETRPQLTTPETRPPLYYCVSYYPRTGFHTRGSEPGSYASRKPWCKKTATEVITLWPADKLHEWEEMVVLDKRVNTSWSTLNTSLKMLRTR